jgi:hypothetical protein
MGLAPLYLLWQARLALAVTLGSMENMVDVGSEEPEV